MKAAILCPGPSLTRTWCARTHGDADLLIAVNEAATFVTAGSLDTWAAGDYPAIQRYRDRVRCQTLFTTEGAASHLRDIGEPIDQAAHCATFECVTFESLYGFVCPHGMQGINWSLLTLPAAIVYAASRGATLIEAYGADWSGIANFAGEDHPIASARSDERWKMEAEIVGRLIEHLARRGVAVRRVREATK